MRAAVSATFDELDGRPFARDLRSEPPFAIRRADTRFLLVGSAAAPVRGDILDISIDIAPNARIELGTVAATMVWPGPDPELLTPSRLTTTIRVAHGGHLIWRPEPTVSVVGSDHIAQTLIQLEGSATCEVVEEYSLGRSGETSGRLTTQLRVVRAGQPLVHLGECFDPAEPGALTTAGAAFARHIMAAVVVGAPAGASCTEVTDPASDTIRASAWLPVATDAGVFLGAGADRPSVLADYELNRARHRSL